VFAVVTLIVSVSLKGWAGVSLMRLHRPENYMTSPAARRLFLLGKITPLTACAAMVALAYCSRLWWLVVPAWLFFGVIVIGIIIRVRQARSIA
jgi:hypothetical protein